MSTADFTTWLRGFLAACGDTPLSAGQMEMIRTEMAKVVSTPTATFVPTFVPVPYQPPFWIDPSPRWVNPSPYGGVQITCGAGFDPNLKALSQTVTFDLEALGVPRLTS